MAKTIAAQIRERIASSTLADRLSRPALYAASLAMAALAPSVDAALAGTMGVVGVLANMLIEDEGRFQAPLRILESHLADTIDGAGDDEAERLAVEAINQSQASLEALGAFAEQAEAVLPDMFRVTTEGGRTTIADVTIRNMGVLMIAMDGGQNDVSNLRQEGGSADFRTGPGSHQSIRNSEFVGRSTALSIAPTKNTTFRLGTGRVKFNGQH